MPDCPEAKIVHVMAGRLRLRVPEMKGDRDYFLSVAKVLESVPGIDQVSMNPDTAGILLVHRLETSQLQEVLASSSLFQLTPPETQSQKTGPGSLHGDVKTCFAGVSSEIERLTGRTLNVSEPAFLGLLGAGALQIGKGNFTAIPWYTAFWYALNIFLKSDAAGKSN